MTASFRTGTFLHSLPAMQNSELVGPGKVIPNARRSTNSWQIGKGKGTSDAFVAPHIARSTREKYLVSQPTQFFHKKIVKDCQVSCGSAKSIATCRQYVTH